MLETGDKNEKPVTKKGGYFGVFFPPNPNPNSNFTSDSNPNPNSNFTSDPNPNLI